MYITIFLPYIQIIIQSRLDQSMEENQDLKVCQEVHIFTLREKIMEMLHTIFRTVMGRREGIQAQEFSCICIMSLIERER